MVVEHDAVRGDRNIQTCIRKGRGPWYQKRAAPCKIEGSDTAQTVWLARVRASLALGWPRPRPRLAALWRQLGNQVTFRTVTIGPCFGFTIVSDNSYQSAAPRLDHKKICPCRSGSWHGQALLRNNAFYTCSQSKFTRKHPSLTNWARDDLGFDISRFGSHRGRCPPQGLGRRRTRRVSKPLTLVETLNGLGIDQTSLLASFVLASPDYSCRTHEGQQLSGTNFHSLKQWPAQPCPFF